MAAQLPLAVFAGKEAAGRLHPSRNSYLRAAFAMSLSTCLKPAGTSNLEASTELAENPLSSLVISIKEAEPPCCPAAGWDASPEGFVGACSWGCSSCFFLRP